MWICPDFTEKLQIVPLKDPDRRKWDISFSFQNDRIAVRGHPSEGRYGLIELDAAVSLWPVKEISLKPEEKLTPLQFYNHCRFTLFIEDILVSDKGKHLDSFVMLYVIRKFRLPIAFSLEAVLQGRLGGKNEQTTEASIRRQAFWTKLGCSLNYNEGLLSGNLKEIINIEQKLDILIDRGL